MRLARRARGKDINRSLKATSKQAVENSGESDRLTREEFETTNGVLDAARHYHAAFGADADAVAITLGLRRANTLLVTSVDRFVDSMGLGVNLSVGRLSMLRAIYFGEDHRLALNELGRQMRVSRTNITNLIDALERDGLVERTINLSDRRVINAQLTAKGLDVCAIALPGIAGFMEDICRNFTPGEKSLFVDFLTRLQADLSGQVSPDEGGFQDISLQE